MLRLVLLLLLKNAFSFGVDLPSGQVKCLGQNVYKDDFFSCNYSLNGGFATTSIKVVDSSEQVLYQKDSITTGKFGFSIDKNDRVRICFTNNGVRGGPSGKIYLNSSFKSYEEVNKKNTGGNRIQITIQGMEKIVRFLQILEENSGIFKIRQESLNAELEKQNQVMVLMNVITIVVLISLSAWQFIYLKRYFKEKKLL